MKTVLSAIMILVSSICFGQITTAGIEKIVKSHIGQVTADALLKKNIIFNNESSISVPETYSNKRTGTKDSERGELTGPALLIGYDIGYSAGILMSTYRIKECSAYYNASINGYNVWIGVSKGELMVTITNPDGKYAPSLPANFRATVKNETEVSEVLKIVFSYKPKQK